MRHWRLDYWRSARWQIASPKTGLDSLAVVGEGGLVVVPAAGETVRNDDVTHEFRQDSSFFFLTGFDEPEAVAVIAPGHPESEFTLFVRPRDREMEVWNGYRAGVEGAKSAYGADAAYEIGDLSKELRKLAMGRERLYYRLGGSHDDRHPRSLTHPSCPLRLVRRARFPWTFPTRARCWPTSGSARPMRSRRRCGRRARYRLRATWRGCG